jgi:hypothetical protein
VADPAVRRTGDCHLRKHLQKQKFLKTLKSMYIQKKKFIKPLTLFKRVAAQFDFENKSNFRKIHVLDVNEGKEKVFLNYNL